VPTEQQKPGERLVERILSAKQRDAGADVSAWERELDDERQIMKLTIDREADALYLDLDEAPAAESEEISPGIILDYNADGKVVGIEMLYLSKRVSSEKLGRMQMETVGT
jgi:uncharacterized protein YuzE